jgi:hypothetical protein
MALGRFLCDADAQRPFGQESHDRQARWVQRCLDDFLEKMTEAGLPGQAFPWGSKEWTGAPTQGPGWRLTKPDGSDIGQLHIDGKLDANERGWIPRQQAGSQLVDACGSLTAIRALWEQLEANGLANKDDLQRWAADL